HTTTSHLSTLSLHTLFRSRRDRAGRTTGQEQLDRVEHLDDALVASELHRHKVGALLVAVQLGLERRQRPVQGLCRLTGRGFDRQDRKSTRLNSSHDQISYA